MEKYNASALNQNDLVLVEVVIRRYPMRSENLKPTNSARKRDMSWASWKAFFELRSVSLLMKGSPSSSLVTDDDIDDLEI